MTANDTKNDLEAIYMYTLEWMSSAAFTAAKKSVLPVDLLFKWISHWQPGRLGLASKHQRENKGTVSQSFHPSTYSPADRQTLPPPQKASDEGLGPICRCSALMQTREWRWMHKAVSPENEPFQLLLANLKLSPFNPLCNFPHRIALAPEQSLLLKWLFNSFS